MGAGAELTREEWLEQELEKRDADLARRDAQIEALEKTIKLLQETVETLKDGLYGRKSERFEKGQLSLFGEMGGEEEASEPEPEAVTVPAHKRRAKGHGRSPFASHLPREVFEHDVPEADRFCSCCGKPLKYIGDDVSERGHYIPAQVVVHEHRQRKWACPDGHGVVTGEGPPTLIDRGKHEPSVYAHIVASKYQDHLPLNRLAGIFKRHGIHLPKQTMWEMLTRVDEVFAAPMLEQMRKEVLREEVLHGDDTPVPVRLDDEKGSRNGRVWAWITLNASKALFDFTLTKERDGPVRFLGDWKGTLILDGASNFNEVIRNNDITRAGCWAHARRKLKTALDRGSKEAVRLLVLVQRLFWIERAMSRRIAAQGGEGDDFAALRLDLRNRRSRPLIARLYEVAEELSLTRSVMPKSELGKALTYLSNQWEPLTRFLDDGRIPIHNNDCERALRHLVTGRKNWLVFGSPRGGKVACNLYSLMLSCRALEINPEAYLTDVLSRLHEVTDLADITPWAWAKQHPEALLATS